ncbi:RHS repeat domain-containing protein [Yoonia sp. R2-816]|uniref:RHS repeat domain-containing protein n=1 Tax=Yoonia sp. R2-816 TaxID=3342638 RepID=UPI003726A14A
MLHLTASGQTIHSVHDALGNRIAEYDYDPGTGTSTLIREYIWASGMIVGVLEAGQLYFVRTDHIGRPVFATDNAGVKVWEATYLPFGGVQTSSGPNSDLRFPGQWFQSETGLHQNWMRDYDPTTGRYMQADPLGLVDGASVYGYALQNPGWYVDPTGQFIPLIVRFLGGCLVGGVFGVFSELGRLNFNEGLTMDEIACLDPGAEFVAGCIAGAIFSPFGAVGSGAGSSFFSPYIHNRIERFFP